MKELHELLEAVTDKESFMVFAKALVNDREPHEGRSTDGSRFVNGWVNSGI